MRGSPEDSLRSLSRHSSICAAQSEADHLRPLVPRKLRVLSAVETMRISGGCVARSSGFSQQRSMKVCFRESQPETSRSASGPISVVLGPCCDRPPRGDMFCRNVPSTISFRIAGSGVSSRLNRRGALRSTRKPPGGAKISRDDALVNAWRRKPLKC